MTKVRFNCIMKEKTRKKLHEIAIENNRSDSNMVEHLIDSYLMETSKKATNTNVIQEMGKCGKKR